VKNSISLRNVPLFKAVKYVTLQVPETYFILGYEEYDYRYIYCIRINDKTGYARPSYNLPQDDQVYVVNNFDIKKIIELIFIVEFDSRWEDVMKDIGKDSRIEK